MSITKAPGSQTNTFLTKIAGVRAYGQDMKETDFEARFTSDEFGETLSLTFGNRQWIVPYGPVDELVNHTRAVKAVDPQHRKICGSCLYYEVPAGGSDRYSCRLINSSRYREETTPYDTCEEWHGC